MASFFRFHRIAAIFVLIAAALWIGTGEFASVGSHQAKAEGAAATTTTAEEIPAKPVTKSRAVSGLLPVFIDHSRKIRISGATQPDKRAVLAARSEGVVNALSLTKGAALTAGQVVMTLEGPETVARAEIAQIALDQRERELKVAEDLFNRGNKPEIQVVSARSDRDAAAAELTLARAALDRLELKAPFAGLVDTVDVEMGEWVQSGAPVATILSLDPIIVRAEVSELDIAFVAPGSQAFMTLVDGTRMQGKVRFVAREASAATRTFPVEIALPNPGALIPAGMTTQVELLAPAVSTVTVPRSVITLSEKGEVGLRVVGADNLARFVTVQIVDDTEAGMVVAGVPADVRIIVAGQDLVRDGDLVDVTEVPAVAVPE